jgi:hypothetical protein
MNLTRSDEEGFGWKSSSHAVSRRPPNPSKTRLYARTEGYTYDTQVWALSLIQGPFYVARAKP